MAITITTQPTTPVAVSSYALFAVSSNLTAQKQFQYVMDVVSGSTVVARIRQYPNPKGVAIFDPSRVMADYIQPTTDVLFQANGGYQPNLDGSTENFTVRFGEEYGISPSSSVVMYDGEDVIGNPSVTGSISTYEAFLGSIPYNAAFTQQWEENQNGIQNSFNFTEVFPLDSPLTYGSNQDNSQQSNNSEFDSQHVSIYDYGVTAMWTPTYTPNVAKMIGTSADGGFGFNITLPTPGSGDLNYIPSGLRNALDLGVSQTEINNTAKYVVFVSNGTNFTTRDFIVDDSVCYAWDTATNLGTGLATNNNLNFIFRNSNGFWDHMSTRKPLKASSNVKRKITSIPFAPWSSADAAYPIDGSNRITNGGDAIYSMSTNQEFRVNLGYLGTTDARIALDLISSKKVYVQYLFQNMGTSALSQGYKPIIITNSSVEELTDKFRQKLFEIEISYRFAIPNRSY